MGSLWAWASHDNGTKSIDLFLGPVNQTGDLINSARSACSRSFDRNHQLFELRRSWRFDGMIPTWFWHWTYSYTEQAMWFGKLTIFSWRSGLSFPMTTRGLKDIQKTKRLSSVWWSNTWISFSRSLTERDPSKRMFFILLFWFYIEGSSNVFAELTWLCPMRNGSVFTSPKVMRRRSPDEQSDNSQPNLPKANCKWVHLSVCLLTFVVLQVVHDQVAW